MISSLTKVVIIGAGFVGSSAAFALAINKLANELVLIDVDREKAVGVELDINHGLCFIGQMNVYAGDYSDIAGADVIVITAGANRKPGENRLDLAQKNLSIMKDIVEGVMKYYTGGAILVVSNPVDIMTYMITKWSDLPYGRVLGTGTMLDSSRFRYLLGLKLGVDIRNVHGYIVGEHGDSQLVAWSTTHIAGVHIDRYLSTTGMLLAEDEKKSIADEVMSSGALIIKSKGVTNYGIAVTVNCIVETITKDHNTIRTVSSIMNGQYGISDIALSLPSVIGTNGIVRVIEPDFTDEEIKNLRNSADHIRIILQQVKGN